MTAHDTTVELPGRAPQADNSLRHGHARHGEHGKYSPTYQSWQSMLARCRYPERDMKAKHVGRGISVCARWQSFEAFLADMGERPDGSTLERSDNDGDYEPGNCNRRNKKLDFGSAVEVAVARLRGESCPSIAARFGISESLPREIVKGRSWPDALARAKEIVGE